MNGGNDLASQSEVEALVRSIVTGEDLNVLTPKLVRRAVTEQLGSRVGDDPQRIKLLVKNALDVVLGEPQGEGGKQPHSREPTKKADASDKVEPKAVPETKLGRNTNVDIRNAASEAPLEISTRPLKRARKRIIADLEVDDDDDDDDRAADSNVNDADFAVPVKNGRDDEDEEEFALDSPGSSPEEEKVPKQKRKRVARRSADSASSMSTAERQLKRYLKIGRSIGCPVPPSLLRKKTAPEKRVAVIKFLKDKGFDVMNSANLNKNVMEKFKKKIAQEKELAELDSSNIIMEEEGRPRRRRAPVSYADPGPKVVLEDGEDEEEEVEEEDSPEGEESEGYVGSGPSDDEE